MTGKLENDNEIFLVNANKKEKVGHLYCIIGSKQIEVDKIIAGDIGCIAKVDSLSTFETFCEPKNVVQYPPVNSLNQYFLLRIY